MIFAFTAYNTETLYGYGSQSEAVEYCEYLNCNREINLYYYEATTLDPNTADDICFLICDELIAIADQATIN